MLRMIDSFRPLIAEHAAKITTPNVVHTQNVEGLKPLAPQHDGWIIGNDPALREVFEAGKAGRLKAAVKKVIWVNNVDFAVCEDLGIPITNTPYMRGGDVADIAECYVIALARQAFVIDRGVHATEWPKPLGISLAGEAMDLVGFEDIDQSTSGRLLAADVDVVANAPNDNAMPQVQLAIFAQRFYEANSIVIVCALGPNSHHMLNAKVLAQYKPGGRVVNVASGPMIGEPALEAALHSGKVFTAALDVVEAEQLRVASSLRSGSSCVLGSHNARNKADAVPRTIEIAIHQLARILSATELVASQPIIARVEKPLQNPCPQDSASKESITYIGTFRRFRGLTTFPNYIYMCCSYE